MCRMAARDKRKRIEKAEDTHHIISLELANSSWVLLGCLVLDWLAGLILLSALVYLAREQFTSQLVKLMSENASSARLVRK
jgi:hypothetical protein